MKIKFTLLLITLFLIGMPFLEVQSQEISPARELHKLKNGVLLVRLQTRQASIDRLRESGHHEMAQKVETAQRRKNKEIVSAFLSEFTFSPVLFFYTNDTEALKNGRYDEIKFLNRNLQIDSTIKLTGNDFVIAEFASLKRKDYQKTDKKSGETTTYSDASGIEIGALLLKNGMLETIPEPFPHVRSYESFDSRPASKTVKRLNKKIESLYAKNKHVMERLDKEKAKAAAQP